MLYEQLLTVSKNFSMDNNYDCVIQIRLPYRLFGLTRTTVHKYHWPQIEVIILDKNGKSWQEQGAWTIFGRLLTLRISDD